MFRTTHNVVTNKHKQTNRITNMKTKIISKILLTLGLVLVLGSAVTPVHGGTQPSSASVIGPPDQLPVVNINTVNVSGLANASGHRRLLTILLRQSGSE